MDDEDDFDEESQKRPISFATLDEKEQDYEYPDDFEEDSEEEVNKQTNNTTLLKKKNQANKLIFRRREMKEYFNFCDRSGGKYAIGCNRVYVNCPPCKGSFKSVDIN